jgi:hypothetical protein
MTILSKQFGNYTFKTCSDTGFINRTAKMPKKLLRLNEYMERPTFFKSVMSDFDKIVRDNRVG